MGRAGKIYRRLRARILDQPTGFTWIYPGKLAASGLPSSEDQVRWLTRQGVESILTLTEFPLPEEWLAKNGIQGKHIPMKDHGAPSIEALKEAAGHIERELNSGKVVLTHCLAGRGRTGTVIAAYLMKAKGMSMNEAVRFVRERKPGAIEEDQEGALTIFGRSISKGKR